MANISLGRGVKMKNLKKNKGNNKQNSSKNKGLSLKEKPSKIFDEMEKSIEGIMEIHDK
jgi:hypothetical protein